MGKVVPWLTNIAWTSGTRKRKQIELFYSCLSITTLDISRMKLNASNRFLRFQTLYLQKMCAYTHGSKNVQDDKNVQKITVQSIAELHPPKSTESRFRRL